MILKKLGWKQFRKHNLVVKMKRGVLGDFGLVFEDTLNNCILHEYWAPLRSWERWELGIVYGIFRMQIKEIIE